MISVISQKQMLLQQYAQEVKKTYSEKILSKMKKSAENLKASTETTLTKIKKKAKIVRHEAEEIIPKASTVMRRRLSSPNLEHLRSQSIAKKIAAKHGTLWECVDCAYDKYGGELYTFKLKPQYDPSSSDYPQAEENKIDEIFPAVEPNFINIFSWLSENFDAATAIRERTERDPPIAQHFFPAENRIQLNNESFKHIKPHVKMFHALGYSCKRDEKGTYITLPDREALLARWQLLKKKHDLPDLTIASSEDIADDISFVEAYFNHDALLSTGKEFVHDHTNHILSIIALILHKQKQNIPHKTEKFKTVKTMIQSYRKIMIAKDQLLQKKSTIDADKLIKLQKYFKQLETVLGSFVDILTSFNPGVLIPNYSMEKHLDVLVNSFQWDDYWKRRYEDPLKGNQLKELWGMITEIEKEYDKNLMPILIQKQFKKLCNISKEIKKKHGESGVTIQLKKQFEALWSIMAEIEKEHGESGLTKQIEEQFIKLCNIIKEIEEAYVKNGMQIQMQYRFKELSNIIKKIEEAYNKNRCI
jgi:hypothetical protein